jgi:uncharacterized DUF497 family protein
VFLDTYGDYFSGSGPFSRENREITIGHTVGEELVFVSHYEHSNRIRIISARLTTRLERKQYEEGIGRRT